MANKSLPELKNIGKTVASRLHELGITNEAELRKLGAAKAYKWLSDQNPDKHLPVCYYLYSLEGAIKDKYWDDFSEKEKTKLRLAAGLPK
ncbi:TfoX/Sxy family DNA transformation protein [Alcanivorax sp.]|jgi:DNA transformation protein|uniref:TfoX/Sxy family DNA transformation protein n=1 Tax=Alcanivorax sp. TaxID=1872427 RepID=UPI0032D8CFC1